VCKSCGYVIKVDNIDMRPEFGEEEVKRTEVSESKRREMKKIRTEGIGRKKILRLRI